MKLRELPTFLLRDLAARCTGVNATVGDGRIALRAVADACYAEIDRRIEGGDFPEISAETAAAFAAQIKSSPFAEFARLIYEADE